MGKPYVASLSRAGYRPRRRLYSSCDIEYSLPGLVGRAVSSGIVVPRPVAVCSEVYITFRAGTKEASAGFPQNRLQLTRQHTEFGGDLAVGVGIGRIQALYAGLTAARPGAT